MTQNDTEIVMTRDEILREVQQRAARHGMSARAILDERDSGTLQSPADVADVLMFAEFLSAEERNTLR